MSMEDDEPRCRFLKSQWLYSVEVGPEAVLVGSRFGFLRKGVRRYYVLCGNAITRQIDEIYSADTKAEAIEHGKAVAAAKKTARQTARLGQGASFEPQSTPKDSS